MQICLHCQNEINQSEIKSEINAANEYENNFCCNGCYLAYELINKYGLGNYYNIRTIDANEPKNKPNETEEIDLTDFVTKKNDNYSINLLIQGLHCAACVWLIERVLNKQDYIIKSRVNLTSKTLYIEWEKEPNLINKALKLIQSLGYNLLPLDEEIIKAEDKKEDNDLAKRLAVAGFGVGNVMLLSIVLWFSSENTIGAGTKRLFHFYSALIALPAIIYAARPFFVSALKAIKAKRTNMDVSISIAIILTSIVSFQQSFINGDDIYFDSAIMLTFFLLIGKYIENKVKKKAYSISTKYNMLCLQYGTIIENEKTRNIKTKDIKENMTLVVAKGERIIADGILISKEAIIDNSLITGESLPKNSKKDDEIFSGSINLGESILLKVSRRPENSMLANIAKMTEDIENYKTKFTKLSDKISRLYTPCVHLMALITFIFNYKYGFNSALIKTLSVLIITCPCALALAIPIAQIIMISSLIKKGIIIKSGEVIEKIQKINVIIFDKTGTLTTGEISVEEIFEIKENKLENVDNEIISLFASISNKSKHPISRAVTKFYEGNLYKIDIKEEVGHGISGEHQGQTIKIGTQNFCNIKKFNDKDSEKIKAFASINEKKYLVLLSDKTKFGANKIINWLNNYRIILLSGDRESTVKTIANQLEIKEYYFEKTPTEKLEFAKNLQKNNKIMMFGDGINDAPALKLSDISVSFTNGSDIAKNSSDIIIQNNNLNLIKTLFNKINKTRNIMKQNLAASIIYNLIAIPFAFLGYVSPMVAAISMSLSSLIVLLNSVRIANDE